MTSKAEVIRLTVGVSNMGLVNGCERIVPLRRPIIYRTYNSSAEIICKANRGLTNHKVLFNQLAF